MYASYFELNYKDVDIYFSNIDVSVLATFCVSSYTFVRLAITKIFLTAFEW